MTNKNLSKPELNEPEVIQNIKRATEYVLNKDGITSPEKALYGRNVYSKVNKEYPNVFNENTFIQYLSRAVKDTDTAIDTEGKKRGYYISAIAADVEKLAETSSAKDDDAASSGRKVKEQLLYEFLVGWLKAQDFKAKNISAGKSLGKWGNPYIAGIAVVDSFGSPSLEIITLEAKTSLENWEQWIFEAVSHRRFANRCYFAFAHPEGAKNKIPSDMRYYAELYGIGILVLLVKDEEFKKLVDGNLKSPLDVHNTEAMEYFSAPFNFVQPKYQLKFLKAIEVTDLKGLYSWG